jgi:hypothetical protein
MLASQLVQMSAMRQWTTAGALLLLACQNDGPRTLRDSEGRTFLATCKAAEPCKFEQKSGARRADKPAQALLLGSRLVGLCDVKPGEDPQRPYDCRPLACAEDEDCPPLHGMKHGQCLNRHCSDPAEAIGVHDAVMLCLAGTGLGRETPRQIERYALALNCGSPCQIPAPCQQP